MLQKFSWAEIMVKKKKKKTFKIEHCEMKVPYKQTQN